MKVILTRKEEFASKAGQEYVKVHFLALDGSVGEVFTTAEKYAQFKVDNGLVCTPETLEVFADKADLVDVQFNNRGQVVEVSPVEE
jgi:hypothetical protein